MTLFETANEEQLFSDEKFYYELVKLSSLGLNAAVRPELLPDGQVVNAENVKFEKFSVFSDTGYVKFGDVVVGVPQGTYQYFQTSGAAFVMLVTTRTLYSWNETNLLWEVTSCGTVSTTLASAFSLGQTQVTVASAAGFVVGGVIGVDLEDGTRFSAEITGIAGSVISFSGKALDRSEALVGATVVQGPILDGSLDKPVSFTTWAATDKMYFANGVDPPKSYDGLACQDVPNLPATTFAASLVTVYSNYLWLLNTVEDGNRHPQRVRWSEPGVDNDWNELVNFNDLLTTEDHITAVSDLGPYLIIYRERSIVRVEFVGSTDNTWNFVDTIDNEGVLHQDAVLNLNDFHLIFAQANVYTYEGGFELKSIGDVIYDEIFSITGDLNTSFANRAFGVYVEELDEAWFFYPAGGSESPNKILRYNVGNQSYSKRSFPLTFVGFGFYQKVTALTWNQLVGSWNDQNFTWDARSLGEGSPTIHLCSTNGQVYEYDYFSLTDDGTPISYTLETKDFYVPNKLLRHDKSEFKVQGSGIEVLYSTDRGTSWMTLGVIDSPSTLMTVSLYKQFVFDTLRFKFAGKTLQNLLGLSQRLQPGLA